MGKLSWKQISVTLLEYNVAQQSYKALSESWLGQFSWKALLTNYLGELSSLGDSFRRFSWRTLLLSSHGKLFQTTPRENCLGSTQGHSLETLFRKAILDDFLGKLSWEALLGNILESYLKACF